MNRVQALFRVKTPSKQEQGAASSVTMERDPVLHGGCLYHGALHTQTDIECPSQARVDAVIQLHNLLRSSARAGEAAFEQAERKQLAETAWSKGVKNKMHNKAAFCSSIQA